MFDIITDSACDLTLDTAKQLGIEVVPLPQGRAGDPCAGLLSVHGR